MSSSSIFYARYNPLRCNFVISSNSFIFSLLWSINIWNNKVSLFLLMKSCIGSFILTLFFIALFAASIKLIFALFSSSSSYCFPNSFNSLIVMPLFFVPFSHIFSLSISAFISLFLSFSFSFILKI